MCGINGIYKFNGDKVDQLDLRLMSSAIAHRGPDEAGFSILNNGKVGLANLRLSIIDVIHGHQPMYNEDQSIAIVYNGEIYDHDQHRKDLIEKGHQFNTKADTEVIIHLYEEYGIDCLRELNGEFAFIIWDNRKKKLYVVKDRFGIKPIFYYINKNEAVFASEIKGILALDRIEKRLSPDYIMGMCIALYSQTHSTFAAIKSIKPGHYLEIDANGICREEKYWRPKFETDDAISFSQAKEGVRHYFTAAVKRRMIADVPVGIYLSGGIDSSLVCGIMSKHNQKIRAFNIGFADAVYDESEIARETAKFYNVDFCGIKCTMEMLADQFEKTIYHTEAPIVNPHSVAKQILSSHVHNSGYKVCITGEGGDEYFAGYPYFKLEQILSKMLSGGDEAKKGEMLYEEFCRQEAASEILMWDRITDTWKKGNNVLGYSSYIYERALRNTELFSQILNTEALGITSEHNAKNLLLANYDYEYIKSLHPINASRNIALNQLHAYMIPLLGDRVEMANSVEGRLPFLDRDFVEFAGKLSPQYLLNIDELREKCVLREAFSTELPPHIRKGKKHSFLTPNWDHFFETKKGTELKDELLSDSAIKKTNIFNSEFVKGMFIKRDSLPKDDTLRKRISVVQGVMLSLQMIHHHFIQNKVNANSEFQMVDRSPQGL